MNEAPNLNPEGAENAEKLLWRYTYVDHSKDNHPVIFECVTHDISDADLQYEQRFGVKPERQNHIGCSIVKN
jgi:hypothetical protein